MTVSSPPTVKDIELVSFGLVESASSNRVAERNQKKINESELTSKNGKEKEKDDFANTFICHLIFYVLFCVSLVLHILIDLGLGAFVENKFSQLFSIRKKTDLVKGPAFSQ